MDEVDVVKVEPSGQRPALKKPRGPLLNISLFLITMSTTWMVGSVFGDIRNAAINGVVYMASIMGILLSHEMGHYLMTKRNRVDASLPFFLPFPFGFGTLGAVIIMRGRVRSRNAMMEIGAAGPLAGLAVALPILVIGLLKSEVMPLPPPGSELFMEGQSILYMFLKWLTVGPIPAGQDVSLHPMAFAGWAGMLVTMINLLPVGQLDGGHISYALWPKFQGTISKLFICGTLLHGIAVTAVEAHTAYKLNFSGIIFFSKMMPGINWILLGTLLFFFFGRKKSRRFKHPEVDDMTLSKGQRLAGILCLILFVLMFMPIPASIVV